MKRMWATCLVLFSLASSAYGSGGDYVHWILEAPSDSPFAEIRYEVTERGPASAAIHRRRLPGEVRSLHNMGLVPPEHLQALRKALVKEQAMSLPDAPDIQSSGASMTWRFDIQSHGQKHSFKVTDPLNQKDRRYWNIFSTVRKLVRSITGGLPFRDVYFPKEKIGWLNLRSVPAARLTVDGRDTELETPIRDLPLLAGKHTIELKSVEGNTIRRYDVRIEPGGYTKLRVELR